MRSLVPLFVVLSLTACSQGASTPSLTAPSTVRPQALADTCGLVCIDIQLESIGMPSSYPDRLACLTAGMGGGRALPAPGWKQACYEAFP